MAFVRHYFAVVDYAYATGDTEPLAAISHAECLPCGAIKEMIDATIAAGGSYVRSAGVVVDLTVPDGEPKGPAEVHLKYNSAGAIERNSAGDETRRLQGDVDQPYRAIVVPTQRGWLTYDYSEIGD